jgi:hypothetical protein
LIGGEIKHAILTSAFKTSNVRSFAEGPNRSMSDALLSKLQTETRLFVTLCEADCTRHSPTFKGGEDGGDTAIEPPG